MKTDDGGPAFPAPGVYGPEDQGHTCLERGEYGMSLLDYFAAHALAGYLAMYANADSTPDPPYAAQRAYQFAAAMLAERVRPDAGPAIQVHHAPDLGGES